MSDEIGVVYARNIGDQIIIMKVGPYDEMWNWYIKVRNLLNDRQITNSEIKTWNKNNYFMRQGKPIQLDTPKEMQERYTKISKDLEKEGITNYDLVHAGICKVGEGMEMGHLD